MKSVFSNIPRWSCAEIQYLIATQKERPTTWNRKYESPEYTHITLGNWTCFPKMIKNACTHFVEYVEFNHPSDWKLKEINHII